MSVLIVCACGRLLGLLWLLGATILKCKKVTSFEKIVSRVTDGGLHWAIVIVCAKG